MHPDIAQRLPGDAALVTLLAKAFHVKAAPSWSDVTLDYDIAVSAVLAMEESVA